MRTQSVRHVRCLCIVHLRRGELAQSRSVMLRVEDIRAAAACLLRCDRLARRRAWHPNGRHSNARTRRPRQSGTACKGRTPRPWRGFLWLFCIRVGMRESAFFAPCFVWSTFGNDNGFIVVDLSVYVIIRTNVRTRYSYRKPKMSSLFHVHGRLRSSGLSDSSSTTTGRGIHLPAPFPGRSLH